METETSLVKTEPLKMIGSTAADREARAKALVTLFVKFLGDHVDLIVQVRQDFLDKPRTETIMECSTFGEYCRNVLHYSESHIRRLIAGRNPATAIFDGSRNRTLPPPFQKLFEGPWQTTVIRLGDLRPNPFRQFIHHGRISRNRVAQFVALHERIPNYFFDSYLYRSNVRKSGDNIFEIIDGHHTLAAAIQVYGPDHQFEVDFKTTITDEQMAHGLYAANLQKHDGFLPWSLRERIDFVVMLRNQYLNGKFPCDHDVPGSAVCVAGHLDQEIAWPMTYVDHLLRLSRLHQDVIEDLEDPFEDDWN